MSMKTYISMLRGINVSGQKMIKMEALKLLYEALNFKNVRTYIQSGNVIFRFRESPSSKLAKMIEEKIRENLGFDITVLIRTEEEFEEVIDRNPFKDIDKLYVTFLGDEPAEEPLSEMNKVKADKERFLISRKEIYLLCPNGYGKTKLSNSFFERKLKVSATTRNWKTVCQLREMAKQYPRFLEK